MSNYNYDLKFKRHEPGKCSKCGKDCVELFTAVVSLGNKSKEYVLCNDCAFMLKTNIEKKNAEQINTIQAPKSTAGNRFCGMCGSPIPEGNTVCEKCGIMIPSKASKTLNNPDCPASTEGKKKNGIGSTILNVLIVIVIIAVFCGPVIFLGCSEFVHGKMSSEAAVDAYISSAHGKGFQYNNVIKMMNEEYLNCCATQKGTTNEKLEMEIQEYLNDAEQSLSYTFSTNPNPREIEKTVTTMNQGLLEQWNETLRSFGMKGTATEGALVDVEINYILVNSISGPEVTDNITVLKIGSRWYVFDSDLISDVIFNI